MASAGDGERSVERLGRDVSLDDGLSGLEAAA